MKHLIQRYQIDFTKANVNAAVKMNTGTELDDQ